MMTVQEVSKKTGVSIRTLHHYDAIGLLPPAAYSESGYRLYDDSSLERLQHILLFRELQFSLEDIKGIVDSPTFDRNKALDQQIALLQMRRTHIDNLISLAKGIKLMGVNSLKFEAFDTKKIDEYAEQAKKSWGTTPAYKEFEQKSKGRSREQENAIGEGLMQVIAVFGTMKHLPADAPEAQAQAARLQAYITEHYYTCTKDILRSLGSAYGGGGSMTENINRYGGEGCAQYAAQVIEIYCREA